MHFIERGACTCGNVHEMPVAQIEIQNLRLTILGAQILSVHFGVDVTVGDQDSGPAGIIEIEELYAPAQPIANGAQTSAERDVVKKILPAIPIERGGIVAEISLDDVLPSAVSVVVGGSAHAGLHGAVAIERHASQAAHVGKSAVMIIVVEKIRGGIAGDVDIGPAILVEIGGERSEAVAAGCFRDS